LPDANVWLDGAFSKPFSRPSIGRRTIAALVPKKMPVILPSTVEEEIDRVLKLIVPAVVGRAPVLANRRSSRPKSSATSYLSWRESGEDEAALVILNGCAAGLHRTG
jgi:hypothetical protein